MIESQMTVKTRIVIASEAIFGVLKDLHRKVSAKNISGISATSELCDTGFV